LLESAKTAEAASQADGWPPFRYGEDRWPAVGNELLLTRKAAVEIKDANVHAAYPAGTRPSNDKRTWHKILTRTPKRARADSRPIFNPEWPQPIPSDRR